MGSWEWATDGDVASYSDRYFAVTGRNQLEATFEGLLSIVHPEDRYRVLRAIGQARRWASPGVGLGLPLSRLVAEQQSGTLRYIDNSGGATFGLTLPVAVRDTDLAKKKALNPDSWGESAT